MNSPMRGSLFYEGTTGRDLVIHPEISSFVIQRHNLENAPQVLLKESSEVSSCRLMKKPDISFARSCGLLADHLFEDEGNIRFFWCGQWDLNPYGCPYAPQTYASASSAMTAHDKRGLPSGKCHYKHPSGRLSTKTNEAASAEMP